MLSVAGLGGAGDPTLPTLGDRAVPDVVIVYIVIAAAVAVAWRWPYSAALAVGIIGPLVAWRTIWDLGHFLATAVGIAAGWVAARGPAREPMCFQAFGSSFEPRRLPTFEATTALRPDEQRTNPLSR